MNILVEDDLSKFPYRLLKGNYGNTLIGCEGNYNITSFIEGELSCNTIVYIDVVADNSHTIEIYNEAVAKAKTLQNVYIVPIPCIEHCFIKAFLGYSVEESSTALDFGDYRVCVKNHHGKKLRVNLDFEKFCKSVVSNYTDCFRGKFAAQDCLCSRPVSNFCTEGLTLENKIARTLNSMPVTLAMMNIFMKGNKNPLLTAINRCGLEYYTMAKNFCRYGIIHEIAKINKQF